MDSSSFDTTAWVIQSVLIMFAVLLAIPLLRALIGLALISLSAALGLHQSPLKSAGVSLLPAFLRTALGFATVVALTQPAAAASNDPPPIVIDRVVSSSPSSTPAQSTGAASTPAPKATTSKSAERQQATPKTIVFDDEPEPESTSDSFIDEYTVVVGDSLWTIARGLIDDPQPSARSIDRAWRTLWEANRAVIGPDPSLIRPGTVLKLNRADVLNNIR